MTESHDVNQNHLAGPEPQRDGDYPAQMNGEAPESATRLAKTVSAAKLAANRANSKKSTGPTSARGKQIARTNHLKHGIFAKQLVLFGARILPDYEDFEQLRIELRQQYPPRSVADDLRLEKLAIDLWRLARAHRAEIVELSRDNAFQNRFLDKVLRYSAMMEKVAKNAFATLEVLEREAAPPASDEEGDTVEVTSASDVSSVNTREETGAATYVVSAGPDFEGSAIPVPHATNSQPPSEKLSGRDSGPPECIN